jgi:hypothetical protein
MRGLFSFNWQYGIGNDVRDAFLAAMAGNNNVRRLQGGIRVSDGLTAAYCREQLTFRVMQALPVGGLSYSSEVSIAGDASLILCLFRCR